MSEFLHSFQGKSNREICIMLSMQNCASAVPRISLEALSTLQEEKEPRKAKH